MLSKTRNRTPESRSYPYMTFQIQAGIGTVRLAVSDFVYRLIALFVSVVLGMAMAREQREFGSYKEYENPMFNTVRAL